MPPPRQRFRREALALSELNHANIATVHDFDTCDEIDYLVEELIPGKSLQEMLESGALEEEECIDLGKQLCAGLAAAHERGIIHRDIKPGNIFITPEEHLKILDFGLAKSVPTTLVPGGEAPTPEQLTNKKLDARTDIWSAGAVLYEMATGRRAFPGSGATLTDAILHASPASTSNLNQDVSPGLEAIIQKCLEKDPGLRYQSAREVAVDLKRLTATPSAIQVARPSEGISGSFLPFASHWLSQQESGWPQDSPRACTYRARHHRPHRFHQQHRRSRFRQHPQAGAGD